VERCPGGAGILLRRGWQGRTHVGLREGGDKEVLGSKSETYARMRSIGSGRWDIGRSRSSTCRAITSSTSLQPVDHRSLRSLRSPPDRFSFIPPRPSSSSEDLLEGEGSQGGPQSLDTATRVYAVICVLASAAQVNDRCPRYPIALTLLNPPGLTALTA
jgi:hypothetical protein